MKTLPAAIFILANSVSVMSIAATRSVTLSVAGMTCPTCPITVKKSLQMLTGVEAIHIDYSHKTVTVSYDDSKVRPAQLTTATANAGYPSTIKP